MSAGAKDFVVLGRISGLFGVKGWIKVHSYTDPREGILDYREWHLSRDSNSETLQLAEGRKHGKALIARIDGIEDRDAAADLVGAEIRVGRAALPATEEGQYYWADLEGLQVVNRNGKALGKVDYLLETGANDVLVVKGEQEVLIPFIKGDVIESVDLAAGVVHVNWEWE